MSLQKYVAENYNQSLPHGLKMNRSGIRVGVIGGGYVGSAVANFFRNNSANVKVYDKYKDSDELSDTLAQDYIFICVPTDHKDGHGIDLSAMDDAMANASRSRARAVIIKSTIVPGTTEKYQKQYPHIRLLFNPEFLTELNAHQDFSYPDRQIVGYTEKSYEIAGEVLQLLPLAPFSKVVRSSEAEMVKYFGNTWFATKVIFANQMYDVCEKLGINYDLVAECAGADRRIGRSHLDVMHGGYRGYGGECLPKDTKALIKFAEDLGLDVKLLRTVEELNNLLLEDLKK